MGGLQFVNLDSKKAATPCIEIFIFALQTINRVRTTLKTFCDLFYLE